MVLKVKASGGGRLDFYRLEIDNGQVPGFQRVSEVLLQYCTVDFQVWTDDLVHSEGTTLADSTRDHVHGVVHSTT